MFHFYVTCANHRKKYIDKLWLSHVYESVKFNSKNGDIDKNNKK